MNTATDNEFAENLVDLLGDHLADEMNYGAPIRDVRTFEAAGVLTYNAGLVVLLEDGTEYQLTIVRSR